MSKWFIAFALVLAGATLAHAQPAPQPGATPQAVAARPGGPLFEGEFPQNKARILEFLKAQSQITQGLIGCLQAAATSAEARLCHEKTLPQRKAVMEKFRPAPVVTPAGTGQVTGAH